MHVPKVLGRDGSGCAPRILAVYGIIVRNFPSGETIRYREVRPVGDASASSSNLARLIRSAFVASAAPGTCCTRCASKVVKSRAMCRLYSRGV